ncbi:MAG: HD domain-containing protein [Lachnospiraceae bacterium]|nr:HD domain-containing protein [Lachnospiraceae bacterium]
MKSVKLSELKGGEILSCPVLSKSKEVLIPEGIELKKEYIDLLQRLEVETVSIIDTEATSRGLVLSDVKFDEYVKNIKRLLEKHTYTGKDNLVVTKDIAESLLHSIDEQLENDDKQYEIYSHEADLYEHTLAVTIISTVIGRKLKLSDTEMRNLMHGAILHDLGIRYITVPYINIDLEKNGPAEVFEYKKHTILAYTVLENEKWLSKEARNIILSHHEKMNGAGFPLKQKKQDIICRIVQFADAYDCLISGMECVKRTKENVDEHFAKRKGVEYDSKIMDVFYTWFK